MKSEIQGYYNGLPFTHAFRQGEILFFKLADRTQRHYEIRALRVKSGVIRTGEKEGHQHKVEGQGQLFMFPDTMAATPGEAKEQPSQGIVEVGDKGAKVTHPEHAAVKLPPGKYAVQTQKEAAGKNKTQSVKD